ncbi:MAG: Prepilin peptidase [Firmicutes bacterium]|nr:Prepilin peptidase [Bacillota bacterium]
MLSVLVFILGLAVGSFLTTCIYRLPLQLSIVKPRSYCPFCRKQLASRDLVPVISLLLLRGRCRFCGEVLPRRYIYIELLTALIYLWCFFVFGSSLLSIKAMLLATFLIGITVIDLDYQLILDKVVIWLAGIGVFINLVTASLSLTDIILAVVTGGGVFLLIAVITKGGMGGGDIKFVAALGIWLGLKLTLLTVLLSFFIGGLGSALLLLTRVKKRKDFIPFGPFIAVGAFLSMLYGEQLISWYLAAILK